MEALCAFSILGSIGLGSFVLIIFGGSRLYKKKGLVSPLLFIAGILIGFVFPIMKITGWMFWLGTRGDLPIRQILIGIVLITIGFFFPTQSKLKESEFQSKCPVCGATPLSADDLFCRNCGASLYNQ